MILLPKLLVECFLYNPLEGKYCEIWILATVCVLSFFFKKGNILQDLPMSFPRTTGRETKSKGNIFHI